MLCLGIIIYSLIKDSKLIPLLHVIYQHSSDNTLLIRMLGIDTGTGLAGLVERCQIANH